MIVGNDSLNWAPAWSPDGRQLYYSSDVSGSMNLWRVATDRDGRPADASEQVTASPLDAREAAAGEATAAPQLNVITGLFDNVKP